MTVKSLTASIIDVNPTGDYAYDLTLPIDAPSLGPYSASLPIVFAPQLAVAGMYTVQASATGYVTQSFDKDISATNATQDFTLMP